MVKELQTRGHDIIVFRPLFGSSARDSEAIVDGVRVKTIQLSAPWFNPRRLGGGSLLGLASAFLGKLIFSLARTRVVHAVRSWHPDIVWQHDFSSNWLATRRLSHFFPVVLTNHTGEYLVLSRLPWGKRLVSLLLRHYAAIIGPSVELTPPLPDRAVTIPNGVDAEVFSPIEQTARRLLRKTALHVDHEFVVLCPRRWAPTKGIIFLARAIRELDRQYGSDLQMVFAFAGDRHEDYPRYADEVDGILQGLRVRVERLGNVDVYRLRDYYRAADLVVIPSLMEAVSLAALEAMACGTAVLATSVGGMTDLVSPGATGYLVDAADANALREAILRARDDPQRSAIALRALDLVRRNYGWRRIAEATERVLVGALAGRRPDDPSPRTSATD